MTEQRNKNKASFLSPKLSRDAVSFLSPWGHLLGCKPSSLGTGWRKRRVLSSIILRRFIIDWVSNHGHPDHIWENCGIPLLSREEQSWPKEEKLCGMTADGLLKGNSGKWGWGDWSAWKRLCRGPPEVRGTPSFSVAAVIASFISQLGRAVVLRYQVSCVSCVGRQILYHCTTWEGRQFQHIMLLWR